MGKHHRLLIALTGMAALSMFSAVRAGEKHDHEHKKGPNGGDIVEVGDKDDHHLEIVHDAKGGKLTVYCLQADLKTPYTPKESLKLNMKTKDGNKQVEFKGKDAKWEAEDEAFKEVEKGPAFEKTYTPRMVVVLADGKKYNVTLEDHSGHDHK